nr:cellulase family glycosylhydrolase [Halomicrobium urmianum]
MDRRQFLAGTAAGAAGALAGCSDRSESASASRPPRLSVEGRWLTDPDGHRVVLRGVNVVDPRWGVRNEDERGKGYRDTLRLATDADAGWHARVLRVPVTPASVRAARLGTLLEDYLDRVVELAAEQGVYVLIDYHAIERYDTSEIDTRLREFWDRVAPRYADEAHVLYELFNEPTEPAGNGIESWRAWRETAQPWVDLIRDRAPETPVLVGSPQWTSMTRFAPEAPFDGEDLLYTVHLFPSWERDTWEANFGDPALDVPVFVTEWGYANADGERYEPHMVGTTEDWGRPFRRWTETHPDVNWCAWTFDSHWAPNMFDHDWNLLGGDDYMGQFTKEWLRDARDEHPVSGDATSTIAEGAPAPPAACASRRWCRPGSTSPGTEPTASPSTAWPSTTGSRYCPAPPPVRRSATSLPARHTGSPSSPSAATGPPPTRRRSPPPRRSRPSPPRRFPGPRPSPRSTARSTTPGLTSRATPSTGRWCPPTSRPTWSPPGGRCGTRRRCTSSST